VLAEQKYREFASLADRAAKGNLIHRNAARRIKGAAAKTVSSLAS
jgi:ribosomal protein S20